MFKYCRFIVLLSPLLLVATPSAVAKGLEDRNWIEVRSENFSVRSAMSEADTLELVRHLELFRSGVALITNIRSTDSPIPTRILAMRTDKDFDVLGLDPEFAGVFLPGLRSNDILIRDVRGMRETTTILHEYAHFLMRNRGEFIYPMWFDEGFAEYLGSSKATRKHFQIGLAAEHRKRNLAFSNWIPMRKILNVEDYYEDWSDEQQSMFYAEAWALVHYLQNRRDPVAPFSEQLAVYLVLVEAGNDKAVAFEEAFGIDAEDLNRQVRDYLERGRFAYFKLEADALLPDFDPEIRRLTREQASLGLAQIALKMGELDMAEGWYRIAASDAQLRPRAEAGLGDVRKFRGEYAAAQPYFEKAVELAPDDAWCRLDLAEYWHDRAMRVAEPVEQRVKYLERAREHYVEAWKLDDSMPEIYAMYGRTFLTEGADYDKAVEMLEEAQRILPSSLDIRLSLAEAYAYSARRADAVAAARSVLAWSNEDSAAAQRAREILSRHAALAD